MGSGNGPPPVSARLYPAAKTEAEAGAGSRQQQQQQLCGFKCGQHDELLHTVSVSSLWNLMYNTNSHSQPASHPARHRQCTLMMLLLLMGLCVRFKCVPHQKLLVARRERLGHATLANFFYRKRATKSINFDKIIFKSPLHRQLESVTNLCVSWTKK